MFVQIPIHWVCNHIHSIWHQPVLIGNLLGCFDPCIKHLICMKNAYRSVIDFVGFCLTFQVFSYGLMVTVYCTFSLLWVETESLKSHINCKGFPYKCCITLLCSWNFPDMKIMDLRSSRVSIFMYIDTVSHPSNILRQMWIEIWFTWIWVDKNRWCLWACFKLCEGSLMDIGPYIWFVPIY